ncbi:hypothetical protein GRI62_05075 [Erythrobacter arachoides]|uniref:Antifreeze protein n=1 Tax=Aurantiacibacter arachoides TaxID=1850444 RepID=A0A845A1Z6_9SPHN|nr:hypothetical protein [Aurantiacibacter arachoides]MXO92977.1 hypothetical protein [Aurantiacibacter arachoides]GGD52970.1 hypothetical protein GCM10011411_11080 [Aurantiacibacter arachoides]
MKRAVWFLNGAALALTSTVALAGDPEDLIPPAFRNQPQTAPSPSPSAAPTSSPSAPGGTPVVQELPDNYRTPSRGLTSQGAPRVALPPGFPSMAEIERMEPDELDVLFGLRPKFDIPVAARRAVERVGVVSREEGGFASASLAGQPAALVRAALVASDGPMVSRWGHILMRRVLASRLDAPRGMDPVEFAALRARALGGMGESAVARALVQDIDGSNYNRALTDAAFNAYLGTGDVLGMCPVARLQSDVREDGEWQLLKALCSAYGGEVRSAERSLDRALGTGAAPEIDVRLAQRYAGAAGEANRAVNIEWDGVEEITPWRFALARALGVELPEGFEVEGANLYADVLIPASPLLDRVSASDAAGARGILSSSAMVDLYSQLYASDRYEASEKGDAALLRDAYVANTAAQRLAAMRSLWEGDEGYGRVVLTAFAAARLPVNEAMQPDADRLIASMLAAGLDANALRWGGVVDEGSLGWALLALAQPVREDIVGSGAVGDFIDGDASAGKRKSAFLIAGLAGLGRLDLDDLADYGEEFGSTYTRTSPWSQKIDRAAAVGNPALVALLAGLGMQGESWERMTPRQLYHIVAALNRVGLSAEARMIAAEAVARG